MKDNKQPTAEAIRTEMIVKFLSIYSPCSPTDPDAIYLTSEEISLKLSPMVQASPTEISALLHTAGFDTIYICGQWRWVLRIHQH